MMHFINHRKKPAFTDKNRNQSASKPSAKPGVKQGVFGKFFIATLLAHYVVLLGLMTYDAPKAYAQASKARVSPIIIRDSEIEDTLKEWIDPLLKAAQISEQNVKIILIQNDTVNAFVAGGANIFLYTGLLEKSKNPEEVIGVLAHELGHITAGHLIGTRAALERASYESLVGSILGIGAAIVTGNGGAASAISSGASSLAQRKFLSYSRINESSADQAAISYLEKAKISPKGLISFMHSLQSEELLPVDKQSEYIRTHPLTANRIEILNQRFTNSQYSYEPLPQKWYEQHKRMKAKLLAFLSPQRVVWEYSEQDSSIAAEYARSIAHYQMHNTAGAIDALDNLLELEPDNPYFLELKAQILMESGQIDQSIPYYQKSIARAPEASLIRQALGHALLESKKPENINKAINNLERVLKEEPRSTKTHRLLATAYGQQGNTILAKLHLAEEALMQRRYPYAKRLAGEVIQKADKKTREWLQAKDIMAYLENNALKDK